nr:MCP four helix bundle domain-containing protein [Massilia forsythiae]
MNIGARLGTGFALVLAMTMAIAGLGVWYLHTIAAETQAMLDAPLAKERMIVEWRMQTFGAVRRTAAIVKSTDPSLAGFFKDDAAATVARTTELMQKIEPMLVDEQEKAQFRTIGDLRKAYTAAKDNAVKAKVSGDSAAAERLLREEFTPAARAYEDGVGKLVEMQHQRMGQIAAGIAADTIGSARSIAVLSAVALLAGVFCSWRLTRGIVRPIRAAVELAQAVAAGDLTRRIDAGAGGGETANGGDETAALLRALR